MTPTRRTLIICAGALAAAGTLGLAGGASAQEAGSEALMQEGPLGEMVLGEADAPVTVIEYASLTCSHCASFHEDAYPQLKSEYIDTGKVRFVFREFPLDPVATAGFMLARCLEEDRYFPFVDAMFNSQRTWAYAENVEDGLFQMARQVGFTRESFEACLTNQEILDGVNQVKNHAAEELDVTSTPTFFVNGEMVSGAVPFEEFKSVIEKHLSS